jgi:hypothetical protein
MGGTVRGGLALTAVAAAALVPLSAAAAGASVTGTELSVYTADSDADGLYGVYARTAAGALSVLVPEAATTDATGLAVTRDGSRFAYVEDTYDAAQDLVRERLVVRDISTRLIRVAEVLTGAADLVQDVALSPDGQTLAWTRAHRDDSGVTSQLLRTAVAGGDATVVTGGDGLVEPAFLDGGTLVARGPSGPVTLPVEGGTPTALAGAPARARDFAVSADGAAVAWALDTGAPNMADTSTDLQVADLVLTPVAGVSDVRTRASGLANESPAWSLDGLTVHFVRSSGTPTSEGDLWSVPAEGSATARAVATTGGVDEDRVGPGLRESAAPAGAGAVPAVLSGTSATVRWSLPADPSLTGVSITRSAPGTPTTAQVFVPAPLTSYVDTGLVVGKTYSYAITTLDRSDNPGPGATRRLVATRAGASIADPTSSASAAAPFRVTFAPAATVTVDYRVNGAGPFVQWLRRQPARPRVFGTPSGGAAATRSTPGNSYSFRLQAFDAYGNATPSTAGGTAVVPFDESRATFTGSTSAGHASDRWLGTVRALDAAGAAARLTVRGNRFQLVGERCPSCGVVDVYIEGRRVAGVDTRASSRQPRRVLVTRALGSGDHVVVVRARGTAGRPRVVVDGFAVRR